MLASDGKVKIVIGGPSRGCDIVCVVSPELQLVYPVLHGSLTGGIHPIMLRENSKDFRRFLALIEEELDDESLLNVGLSSLFCRSAAKQPRNFRGPERKPGGAMALS
jgi:hypothetical protein